MRRQNITDDFVTIPPVCSLFGLSHPSLVNSYSSRTGRIWAGIYNQRGCRPSWLLESFSINDESDYEHEIWKKVLKSMRKVLNLVRRIRRTTSLKWKVVVGKRVGLPTEKARKVDLIYFAGFKCALEDCYKHQHIDIHSGFVLKIGYGLELLAPL